MATEGPMRRDGANYVANSDLSTKQFYCVKAVGSGLADLQTTGGGRIIGVLQNKPGLGQAVDFAFEGFSKAAAGAAYAAGIELMVDATGRLITATSTNVVVANSVDAAGAAGVIATVRVLDTGYVKP
jgi:hypothetical protein